MKIPRAGTQYFDKIILGEARPPVGGLVPPPIVPDARPDVTQDGITLEVVWHPHAGALSLLGDGGQRPSSLGMEYHLPDDASGVADKGETYGIDLDTPESKGPPRRSRSKVTPADVREIRVRVSTGEAYLALAAIYGVTEKQIGMIARREQWRHVR